MIAAAIAILHVTVIDGTGRPPLPDQTVVVRNGRIASIGAARPPRGSITINGAGRFLIPGLWDMHTHVLPRAEGLLRWGITSIRNMHVRRPDGLEIAMRARLAQSGPRVFANGLIIDGPMKVEADAISAGDAASARKAAARLKVAGADFLKVYDFVPREVFFALAGESARLKMPLAGHVPIWVTVEEAVRAGQQSIEHLSGIFESCTADKSLDQELKSAAAMWLISRNESTRRLADTVLRMAQRFDESTCDPLIRLLAEKQVFQCPTLVVLDRLREPAARAVGLMRRAGVPILAGTDAGSGGIVPGVSLHEELELLAAAGLTTMETLQTATINAARLMRRDKDLGTIEKGKLADLVLLDADPLDDIRNTRRIRAVISRGRLISVE